MASKNGFFQALGDEFRKVDLENGEVPIVPFLEACTKFIALFDVLGPTLFLPVKKDMGGNVEKLLKAHKNNPGVNTTMQKLIQSEIDSKTTLTKNSSTDALMWLMRGLLFLRVFIETLFAGTQSLKECASKAYEESLSPYHGFIVRNVFKVATNAVGTRQSFLDVLKTDEETLAVELKYFLESFTPSHDLIKKFYDDNKLHDTRKV